MSPLAGRVVFAASTAVGLKEEGGPNKGPPVDLFAGGREEPWCAHFIATLFREEEAPLPGDVPPSATQHNPIAAVATMWHWLVASDLVVERPIPGDIVVFRSRMGSDGGPGMHCGLVSAVNGSHIQTIEGNSGDSVARRAYSVTDSRILGFARPR